MTASAEAIEDAFAAKKVLHPRLDELIELLKDIDKPSKREVVIILVGPTGGGKSTAVDAYVKYLAHKYHDAMVADPGLVPFILIRLPAPLDGKFNWKDAFLRLLAAYNEILIKQKLIAAPEATVDGEVVSAIRSLVREELRRAIEHCVKYRGTQVLILDEASSLLLLRRGITPEDQFEIIRSLSVDLGIPILLSGSYKLLGILEMNGALIRRAEVIHFPPYTVAEFVDRKSKYGLGFCNVVFSLLEAIPLTKEDGLLNHMDYFLVKSLGCVGLLKPWLQRAVERSLKSKDQTLTREILEATSYKNRDLLKIMKEMKVGEQLLKDIDLRDLAVTMGFEATPSLKLKTPPVAEKSKGSATRSGIRKPRKVGARNPSRDPVGELA